MKNLSAIVLIALLFSLPSCKFFRSKGLFNKKAALTELKAKEDSTRVADSIKQVQDKLLAIEMENDRIEAERKAEEEKLELESRLKYNIVVGSFITPQYALDYAEEYRKLGYDPKIIKMDGSRFELVVAESYESFNKAFQRLIQFQDTVDMDTWMYIRK